MTVDAQNNIVGEITSAFDLLGCGLNDDVGGRLGRSLVTEVSRKRAAYQAAGARLTPASLTRSLSLRTERLAGLAGRAGRANAAALRQARRTLAATTPRLDIAAVARIVLRQRQRLEQSARLMRSYSYEAVLERGFALVVGPGGVTVRDANQVKTGDALMIRVSEGDFGATVSGPGRPKSRRSLPRRKPAEGQGKLL